MNFKIPIAGLLIGLLVACSETKHDPTVQLTPKQQQLRQSKPKIKQPPETGATKPTNPFDGASFPKESCGDKLSNDSKTDPVNFYPVFIDYTESNLRAVKANYCRDALKKLKKDKGKEVIQVASFTSEERANQFKEFLENKLGSVSAEVGEPRIRAVNPKGNVKPQAKQANDSTNNLKSAISIGKAAQLTPNQVKQLRSIIFQDLLGKKHQIEAIVPAYIPSGFKLKSFEVFDINSEHSVGYEIIYRNASNSCFSIHSYSHGSGAGPPIVTKNLKEVNSPALGKVIIGYTDFDKTYNYPYIAANLSHSPLTSDSRDFGSSRWGYSFRSPHNLADAVPVCNTISLVEAVKIVESLSYLYPDVLRNLDFSNGVTDRDP
jgi:serine/threonine-protein kinase